MVLSPNVTQITQISVVVGPHVAASAIEAAVTALCEENGIPKEISDTEENGKDHCSVINSSILPNPFFLESILLPWTTMFIYITLVVAFGEMGCGGGPEVTGTVNDQPFVNVEIVSQSHSEQPVACSQVQEAISKPQEDSSSVVAEPKQDDKSVIDNFSTSDDPKKVNVNNIFMMLPETYLHNLCSLLGHEGIVVSPLDCDVKRSIVVSPLDCDVKRSIVVSPLDCDVKRSIVVSPLDCDVKRSIVVSPLDCDVKRSIVVSPLDCDVKRSIVVSPLGCDVKRSIVVSPLGCDVKRSIVVSPLDCDVATEINKVDKTLQYAWNGVERLTTPKLGGGKWSRRRTRNKGKTTPTSSRFSDSLSRISETIGKRTISVEVKFRRRHDNSIIQEMPHIVTMVAIVYLVVAAIYVAYVPKEDRAFLVAIFLAYVPERDMESLAGVVVLLIALVVLAVSVDEIWGIFEALHPFVVLALVGVVAFFISLVDQSLSDVKFICLVSFVTWPHKINDTVYNEFNKVTTEINKVDKTLQYAWNGVERLTTPKLGGGNRSGRRTRNKGKTTPTSSRFSDSLCTGNDEIFLRDPRLELGLK
ncbi:HECT-like protein [Artemisia annua]|uniref:HECT-like protein n=1 Tax=Artemisia annua TaxID=35608 RepID=A0A2U1KXN0_ARTAN|nr:HECT-like protein [Artemisia annua]